MGMLRTIWILAVAFGMASVSPANAFIEAFNSKFRSECLNAHWFMSLDDARSKMEDWRRYYNEERPHSAIGQNVPILLHYPGDASSPSLAKEAANSSLR